MEPPQFRYARRSLILGDALAPALGTGHDAAHSARARGGRWNPPAADIAEIEAGDPADAQARARRFHALYREHFDFVFRNLRRLGIPAAAVDDALQDVFLVVLRRLETYREGTHPRAWLFAIALRIAGNYRRGQSRRAPVATTTPDVLPSAALGPFEQLTRSEAARVLHGFLDSLDDDKRAVFVLAELEQMTAPEIAEALGVNPNTVYSRLRTARLAFEQAVRGFRGAAPGRDCDE